MVISLQRVFRPFAFFAAVVGLTLSSAFAAEFTAELDRDSVSVGNGAMLTLRISGGRAAQPEIPAVENLIVQPRGQNQQFQIINGQSSISTSYSYVVGSQVPGDYEIPAIEIRVDGELLRTLPLKLKVLSDNAGQPPAGMTPQPAGGPPAEEAAATDEGDEKRFGFLTVEVVGSERKHAYVGEIAPVRIRAWLPENARANLRSGIQPEGKAFTLHNVSSRPQQTTEIKDGKRYTVVTWYGGMSATKAGSYPASLSVDATVAVRDTTAPRPRPRRGGAFDDPFFDSIFDNMHAPMVQKDVTLKSDDQEIEVRPLPTDGRPEQFTGAVGNFIFERVEIPSEWVAGEPQQIGVRLGGSGNFALMKAPQVVPPDNWRSYSGKDQFAAGDAASFSGTKTFQFSAVPRKGGNQDVSLAFSFFDPAEGNYKTISSPVKEIHVSGADLVELEADAAPAADPVQAGDQLVAQKLAPGPVKALEPLVTRPGFVNLLILAVIFAVTGKLLGWQRRRRDDPRRAAALAMENATREALENARRCAEARDVAGFFHAARLALQQRLGARWNQPPQAITSAEVGARIPNESPVAAFFREADLHEYSRQTTGEILPRWRALLDEALASITHAARS